MKAVCLVLLLGAAVSSVLGIHSLRELVDKFEDISKKCLGDLKLDIYDVSDFYDGYKQHMEKPKDEKVLCYFKCVVQELELMDEEGNLTPKTEDYPNDVASSIMKCKDTKADNVCEKAFKASKCFMDSMEEIHRPSKS